MQLILHWLVLAVAFWLTAMVVPGFRLKGIGDAIVVAAIFGIVNYLLGTILYWTIGIATLGIGLLLSLITHWFVNAVLLKITAGLSSRLSVESFGTALIAALVMSLFGKVGVYVVNLALHQSPPGSVYL